MFFTEKPRAVVQSEILIGMIKDTDISLCSSIKKMF